MLLLLLVNHPLIMTTILSVDLIRLSFIFSSVYAWSSLLNYEVWLGSAHTNMCRQSK